MELNFAWIDRKQTRTYFEEMQFSSKNLVNSSGGIKLKLYSHHICWEILRELEVTITKLSFFLYMYVYTQSKNRYSAAVCPVSHKFIHIFHSFLVAIISLDRAPNRFNPKKKKHLKNLNSCSCSILSAQKVPSFLPIYT